MKYRVLMIGKNRVIMEDFLSHLWMKFEFLTCSVRYEDIKNHLRYFVPDALVYCLLEEDTGSMQQVDNARDVLREYNVPLIIVGSREDCSAFHAFAPNYASLTLEKPFTTNQASDMITGFLDRHAEKKRAAEEAEEAAKQEMDIEDYLGDASDLMMEIERLLSGEAPQAAEGAEQAEEAEQVEAAVSKEATKAPRRKHVLVIDDEPLMLKLIKEQLRKEYDVGTAISGKVAMKFLETKKTDLILLDYEMPEEDGPTVLGKLHRNPATRDIPVVFLTSIVDRDKIEKVLQLKPQGYLLKPVDHRRLMKTIHELIG